MKNNAWYLIGYALERQEQRTFKLTRLSDLKIEDTQHDEIAGHPWLTESEEPLKPVRQVTVDLIFVENLKYRVFEDFPRADITQLDSGGYEVVTALNTGEWLISHLLSFGSGLTVVGPEPLRDKMREELQKMLVSY